MLKCIRSDTPEWGCLSLLTKAGQFLPINLSSIARQSFETMLRPNGELIWERVESVLINIWKFASSKQIGMFFIPGLNIVYIRLLMLTSSACLNEEEFRLIDQSRTIPPSKLVLDLIQSDNLFVCTIDALTIPMAHQHNHHGAMDFWTLSIYPVYNVVQYITDTLYWKKVFFSIWFSVRSNFEYRLTSNFEYRLTSNLSTDSQFTYWQKSMMEYSFTYFRVTAKSMKLDINYTLTRLVRTQDMLPWVNCE